MRYVIVERPVEQLMVLLSPQIRFSAFSLMEGVTSIVDGSEEAIFLFEI